jgi:hypothetical protein
VLYSIAFGVDAGRRALLVTPGTLLGAGLLVALASGIPAVLVGDSYLTAQWIDVPVGRTVVAVGTPLVFDVGVFLAVIGVVLTIVFTLEEVTLTED